MVQEIVPGSNDVEEPSDVRVFIRRSACCVAWLRLCFWGLHSTNTAGDWISNNKYTQQCEDFQSQKLTSLPISCSP